MKKIISVIMVCVICGVFVTGCTKVGDNTKSGPSVATAVASSDEVTPEFKATMDGYEAFQDEYIEFMKLYDNMTDTTDIMPQYREMMKKYTAMAGNMKKIDKTKLSPADKKYYSEVMLRVGKKLMDAAQ